MPQFNAYPALQAQTFDLPALMQQAADLQGTRQKNRLMQRESENRQAMGGLVPGIMAGDEGAIGQAAALDPEMTAKYLGIFSKMDANQKAQAKERLETLGGLLQAVESSPPVQRPQMYAMARERAQALGIAVDSAPSTYDPNWTRMKIAEAGQLGDLLKRSDKAPKIETFYTPKGGSQKRQWDPGSKEWQSVGGVKPPSGMSIRVNKDGSFELVQGPGAGLQRKTLGDIEEKLVGAREGLSRLRGIAAKFKPKYQEIPTRLGVAWTGLKARFGSGDVSSEDRKALTEFADYRRDAISNINLYIKEITGAQMSEAEADRLRLAVPDPGEGIFGGDDPITFKAKLDSAVQELEKAAVRYEHYLNQGITDPEEIARLAPLDAVRTAVNEQTGERLAEIGGQWVPMK